MRLADLHTNRLLIKLYKQETEICCRKDNGFIKTQTDIHRHGPVQPSNICQHLDPPHFSLVTTFKFWGFFFHVRSAITIGAGGIGAPLVLADYKRKMIVFGAPHLLSC